MQRLVLSASVLALVSGVALAAPAQAGSYHRHGGLSAGERASIRVLLGPRSWRGSSTDRWRRGSRVSSTPCWAGLPRPRTQRPARSPSTLA